MREIDNRLRLAAPELEAELQAMLTGEALSFVGELEERFGARRLALLGERARKQELYDRGAKPDFRADTAPIRSGSWTVAPPPVALQDRRVEIAGPAGDRKMVLYALGSGANVFLCDLEDANAPTWRNAVGGQNNIRDALARTLSHVTPDGRRLELAERPAVLKMRPRGWHMEEKHALLGGRPISASLFDFGLFAWHNAPMLHRRGDGAYLYLPKLESMEEAALWAHVFVHAEERLGLPRGFFRATVLIETLPAAFEMEEILYALREHVDGLNCGRWDYIFSYIKKLRRHPDAILPDRSRVTMESPFMDAYARLAIRTCHKRGAHCIGGMSAFIPVKQDAQANELALERVRRDKEREARLGHDGTWVAHPALVPVARDVFDAYMPGPNQLGAMPGGGEVTAAELLLAPKGDITEDGARANLSVGIQYVAAWLDGVGAVPIRGLMEDAATAEISRAQLWQWLHLPEAKLADGRRLTPELLERWLLEELAPLEASLASPRRAASLRLAAELFREMTLEETLPEFLTVRAYPHLQDASD
ncbi:malate synthase A [Paenibacillus albicereus]|uniref:Malate synthase n=1 Tax=Paenibacillus albicereus TaxID=2726185 RepID=A0A6H2GY70_9BACL|nr:malate synthase A [Paenibacillus albicereus]QJC52068.1 malate synthase A [Paenibacillus albicereus]